SHQNVVYKIFCEDCDASYVNQTKRKLKTRLQEHKSDIKKKTGLPFVITNHQINYMNLIFVRPPIKIPWKAIMLAVLLFIGGTIMLIMGSLIVSGQIDSKYSDRIWPVIILGALMFIPGAYHMRVAILAYQKVPGYSFDDIPEFD
ncbi:TM230 protein, partial [Acromyrmex charruanus]